MTKWKTHLLDLNLDCQMMILEKLDFPTLLSLAETNEHFSQLVSDIMKRTFQKKRVVIGAVAIFTVKTNRLQIGGDFIEIQNYYIAKNLLRKFGHLIQKLKIYHDNNHSKQVREIYQLLNSYCSKTLQEIFIDNWTKAVFMDEFTNIFENVKNVTFSGNLETYQPLNEIFPSVQHMSLKVYHALNNDLITVEYPHLESLDIQILLSSGPNALFTEDVAERLITENAHIRSLLLRRASPILWKIAADSLSNLENFELDRYETRNYTGESIHFKNVKTFKVNEFSMIHTNITFENLEEFESEKISSSMMESWLQFIERNKALKKLRLDNQCIKFRNNESLLTMLQN